MRSYESPPLHPYERGRDFGAANSDAISHTLEIYERLFEQAAGGPFDTVQAGREALASIRAWAPSYADEIEGIAAGAAIEPACIGALNARTEVLAAAGARRGECSAIVLLPPGATEPVAVQTWDWHRELAESWLVWTIRHPDGRVVRTLTEYGVLGKIGVNENGVGVLLNILHHDADGPPIGVPVHVLARRILDEGDGPQAAAELAGSARLSASSALNIVAVGAGEKTAFTVEANPVRPGYVLPEGGVLIHTNHFLSQPAALGDREAEVGPDSYFRYEILRRRLAELRPTTVDALIDALRSHLGGGGALCCHADRNADFGFRYETLATVVLHVETGQMSVREGGPCGRSAEGHAALSAVPD